MRRILLVVAPALCALAIAACGGDSGGTTSGNVTPPPGPALAGTQPAAPSAAAGTPATASTAGAQTTSIDGTYAFDLNTNGVTAELLMGVRQGQLVLSQLNITNHSGVLIATAPRLRYIDSAQRSTDAITESGWRALYPTENSGLADGQHTQISVGFTGPFDPRAVTFCLGFATEDIGCFTRRGANTPVVPTPAP